MNTSNKTLLIINGLIAIIFGIVALILPEQSMLTFVRYFGLLFIVAGVILLLVAYWKKNKQQKSLPQIIQGIIALFVGLALLIFTRQSIMLFLIIFGAWSVFDGLLKLYLLFKLKLTKTDVYVTVLSALFSIVLGVLLFLNPYKIAALMITIIGLLSLAMGVTAIYLGIKSGKA
jgi:uncharacterized membrane protein HdeD (DUF308 family)